MTNFGWQEINPDQPVISNRDGNFWNNLSIWTGSIIEKEGLYYLFYTARCKDEAWVETPYERRIPQNIGVAVSEDLKTWTRTLTSLEKPVIPNPGIDSQFDGINWRDPYVIKDDIDGQFYAFICAHPKDTSADAGGVIAYATSKDLSNWQDEPYRILYSSNKFLFTEVPQVFWRKTNDLKSWRLYFLFSPRWSSFFNREIPTGITYYVHYVPIENRKKVSYDNIPWETEPAKILVKGLHGGKLIEPEKEENPVHHYNGMFLTQLKVLIIQEMKMTLLSKVARQLECMEPTFCKYRQIQKNGLLMVGITDCTL